MSKSDASAVALSRQIAVAGEPSRRAQWLTVVEVTGLGAIWGGSFLFMRIAAPDFGALPLVELRLALGALVLLPFLWQARARFTAALWLRLAAIGAINSAIPFALFAWAAQRAPAGIGALTNSMAVLFTALVGYVFYREPIGRRRALGLAAGFAGVVVLASGKMAGASVGPAVLAGALAALLYGVGANLIRRQLGGIPASALAAATLLCGTLLLGPFAIATWPTRPVATASWASALLLGGLCTGVAFTFYYRLIHRIGATRAAAVTYLVPLFGILWAWLALGEAPTAAMVLAGALILGGVGLSQNGAPARR
jgi:drug/metabolite transporter (DMT)-like permease